MKFFVAYLPIILGAVFGLVFVVFTCRKPFMECLETIYHGCGRYDALHGNPLRDISPDLLKKMDKRLTPEQCERLRKRYAEGFKQESSGIAH
ncbi:MAG: hypothetical protein WC242_03390 [Candidatus Paceibacterota bacterium]|jgi:hypothetical protein